MTMDNETLLGRQLTREAEMVERGRARMQAQIAKSMQNGRAAETPAGVVLAKRAIAPLVEALEGFLQEAASGKAGRRHTAVKLLKGVPLDLAAYLTVKVAISKASQGGSIKAAAIQVANFIADEMMAAEFEQKEEALYRAVVRNASLRGLGAERIAKSVDLTNRKFNVVEKRWTDTERLILGTKLIELLIDTLGIVQLELVTVRDRKHHLIKLSPNIQEWLKEYNEAATLTRPMYLPTVVPPQDWDGVRGSPYFGASIRHSSILTRSFKGQLDALQEADLSPVYKGLNAIQRTPWRINRRVLSVMEQAWEMDSGLPCLPARNDQPIPESPLEVVNDVKGGEHRKAWRQVLRRIHEANAASRSNRFEFARALSIAQDYRFEAKLYFPHRLDFRGRCYAAATSLTPQGADHAKGLLEFAEGKPLGERGLFWLGVHGANLFGNDKVSLEDRYSWAARFSDKAARIANDPLGNLEWTEADKPWCFLAWCFEWAGMCAEDGFHGDGAKYVSHLPIALDGSCNGIQHFSAMLRDPVGGAAVNLVPADKPSDIYGTVAELTVEKLKAEADPEKQWMAQSWVSFGIDRKITKRAVMVLPYGGTFKSCMDYVREAVQEKIRGGVPNPFGMEALAKASAYLAAVVWSAIGETVIAARDAMNWLQACARVSTKAGLPIRWTTPSGFVCFQDYRQVSKRRITTRFQGTVIAYGGVEPGDALDASKQASAVSPNFVHSLDASAMMLTIGACLDKGINSFAMIHDSYGTHAADTETLAVTLREEFVRMYETSDVLTQFAEEMLYRLPPEAAAELPPLPPRGSLDIRAVLTSPYFFA